VCWSFTDEKFNVNSLYPTLNGDQMPVSAVSAGRFGHTAPIPPWNDMVLFGLRAKGRVTETSFDMLVPGEYTLCVSVGDRQGTPVIALPLTDGHGLRYPVGGVKVGK
jgi:hypothetical protein